MRRFKEELSSVTEPVDIALARLILLVGRLIGEEEMNRIEELFDDILEAQGFPICWDGCNACVRMERYCNEGTKQIVILPIGHFKNHYGDCMKQIKDRLSAPLRRSQAQTHVIA